jgi:2-octaprenyl-6-methoxyphenol hydroxylase
MSNGAEPVRSGPDVLIAGAGLVGLTAAFGLAQAGFGVVCCGAAERTGGGRTVALLDQSVGFIPWPGRLWSVRPRHCAALRLIDDSGTLFPTHPVEFRSAEIGLDAFS